jgi:prolyl 4-hydroxylase
MNKIQKYLKLQHLLTINSNYPKLTILYIKPLILAIPDFLTDTECGSLLQLIHQNELLFIPSQSKSKLKQRQSKELRFGLKHFQTSITQKLQKLIPYPLDHLETPKLTKYTKNDYFLTHQDGISKTNYKTPHSYCQVPYSNRMCTILIYLNQCHGGNTYFNDLKLNIKPEKGKALVFFPCYSHTHPVKPGRLNLHTRHESKPIRKGNKYIYQQWIWNGPYREKLDIYSKDIVHGLKVRPNINIKR